MMRVLFWPGNIINFPDYANLTNDTVNGWTELYTPTHVVTTK